MFYIKCIIDSLLADLFYMWKLLSHTLLKPPPNEVHTEISQEGA